MNEIAINENMEFTDLQNIINKAMVAQTKQLAKQLQETKEEVETLKEQVDISQEKAETLRELELKRHRAEEHRFGYVGQSDLGQIFQVSIGAKTMGKLLRLAGLVKSKSRRAEPLRSAIVNGYAKSFMYGDYPSYQWNPEKCIQRIERWLDDKGILDTFYGIDDEKELADYIKDLHYEEFGF